MLDIETTGNSVGARDSGIVEFACLIVAPSDPPRIIESMINPGMPISPYASNVHGLYDRDVRHAPGFETITDTIVELFETCVVVGFHSKVCDVPTLVHNLARAGTIHVGPRWHLDVRDVWRKQERTARGTLAEVAAAYDVPTARMHRAAADAITTARILDAMLFAHGAEVVVDAISSRESFSPVKTRNKQRSVDRVPSESRQPVLASTKIPSRSARPPSPAITAFGKLVFERIRESGRLAASDLRELAYRCGLKESTASFELSRMLRSGEIQREQLLDEPSQTRILPLLDAAIGATRGTKLLKPIKNVLERELSDTVDYIQLMVALMGRTR